MARPRSHAAELPGRGGLPRALLSIALGLSLAPFVYEGSSLIVARWTAMNGQITAPQTPVLDALSVVGQFACQAVMQLSSRVFHRGPWRPPLLIALALSWAALGSLFLRRCRTR